MKMIKTILFALFVVSGAQAAEKAAAWKAGLATEIITPTKPMWMSGYASRTKPAEGKVHDLWAKALCLEDGSGHRSLLITLDLVGIDRETALGIRNRIAQKHKISLGAVTLACSHTHSGPVVGNTLRAMYFLPREQATLIDEYTQILANRIEAVAANAVEQLVPAVLKQGKGLADFAVNRRNNKEVDVPKLREEGKLAGPVDHDVPVLGVYDPAGGLKGIVFGYACHATVLPFYEWCGDYPGFAMAQLQERHPGVVALFWAGCGADQNPLPRRSVELAKSYGNRLADAVDGVLTKPMQPINGTLKVVATEVLIPFAKVPSREELLTMKASRDKFDIGRADHLLAKLATEGFIKGEYPYPISVWKLGDGPSWVWLGGEVVVDYSLRIKKEHPKANPWVAGYANDVMAYIPSLRVLKEGGYEGATSMVYYGQPSSWGPSVEEKIVNAVAGLLK